MKPSLSTSYKRKAPEKRRIKGEKRDWLLLLKFPRQHEIRRCALFGWEIVSFVSRTTLLQARKFRVSDDIPTATFSAMLHVSFFTFVQIAIAYWFSFPEENNRGTSSFYRCDHPSGLDFSSWILCVTINFMCNNLQIPFRHKICKKYEHLLLLL